MTVTLFGVETVVVFSSSTRSVCRTPKGKGMGRAYKGHGKGASEIKGKGWDNEQGLVREGTTV